MDAHHDVSRTMVSRKMDKPEVTVGILGVDEERGIEPGSGETLNFGMQF